jgi:hypothetical protein
MIKFQEVMKISSYIGIMGVTGVLTQYLIYKVNKDCTCDLDLGGVAGFFAGFPVAEIVYLLKDYLSNRS